MSGGNHERNSDVDALQEKLLRARLGGRSRARRSAIAPVDRSGPLPLSFGQQQMWFLNRLEPDSPEFLVPLAFRLRGPLDLAALTHAWNGLLARHEILRTCYTLADGTPVQVVDPAQDVELPVRDAPGDSAAEREDGAAGLVRDAAVVPFDLERDWPVRAGVVRIDSDDHLLHVVFHHIAFDAWSTGVLVSELTSLYEAFTTRRLPALPELPVQYADFAAWQRAAEENGELDAHLDYWRERLAGLPPTDLPTDRPRPPYRSHEGAEAPFTLPEGLSAQVRELALRHHATPFAVLLAAFQALVARYTGLPDVPVGTVVSGRTRPELQKLIGYGINNLVMRGRWDGDPTFADLVDQAQTGLLEAYEHQSAPFSRLVTELQPERDMSRSPLYQIALTLHERGTESISLPSLTVEPYPVTGGIAKCDLELQVNQAPDGSMSGQLVYGTALFEHETAQRISRHFVRLLQRAVEDESAPLSRIDILDEDERAFLIGGPHNARPVQRVSRTVHELFEDQVARTPDAVAVVAGEVVLTYREVNERANRLARHLRSLGVGPESLVGVCLERDAELIPALIGVLKAGAAYVPLDSAHPVERLGYALADAGASVVVTGGAQVALLDGVFGGVLVVVDAQREVLEAYEAGDLAPVPGAGADN
ncbi:condensation domain-containing protein, partial [Streptomyces sp. NPDC047079]|uniref:condensation domain-containing protein n=1 Tax=Streptomyces sp. NPDC047079 TaxID=3154607 RepID=UPI0033C1F2FB